MAGGGSSDSADEEISGINVTPLVDIVLVLLIIFMVTANLIENDSHEVDLPRAAHGGETVQGPINVVIDKSNQIWVDGAAVDEAQLKSIVHAGLQKDPEVRAMISADQALPYGNMMHVLDVVKGEGVAKFSLTVQADASAAKP